MPLDIARFTTRQEPCAVALWTI